MKNFGWLMTGFAAGAFGVFISAPDVTQREDCQLYRVRKSAVTSYVLKPPVIEQAKCEAFNPAPIVQKCATPEPENAAQENAPEASEEKVDRPRHHRRRHRYRRYWR